MEDTANDLQLHADATCDRCGEPLTLSNTFEIEDPRCNYFVCGGCVTENDELAKFSGQDDDK